MVESYKNKSKIATVISFIAAFIMYLGKDEIAKLLPPGYAFLAGVIVIGAGYIYTQSTEDTRVDIAKQRVHEKYNTVQNDSTANETNDDLAVGDEDGC